MNQTMEALPQIDLAIKPTASFIASKTFIEKIPKHYVEQLIEYEGLNDKWDISNYSQKIAAQNYINEKQQLKSYLANYQKKCDGFIVHYVPAKHKWGRVFPSKSLGMTSFAKKTRNTLIKDLYYDFDLKNCQPEILRCICVSNDIPCKVITQYCSEREEIIASIIEESGGIVTRDLVKSLIIRLSFYGGFDGWLEENNIEPFPEPVIVKAYRNEVSKIAEAIKNKNDPLFRTMERIKKARGETNVMGSFLSTYLQDFELTIVDKVMQWLCCDTMICYTDTPNHFNAIYEFDGIKLSMERVNALMAGGSSALLQKMNSIIRSIGFDIVWEQKPITKYYEIQWVAQPVSLIKEPRLDKSALIAEKKKIQQEETVRLKNENEGFLANNDLEASMMIYSQIKNQLKYSNKIFYYKDNYRWIADTEGVKSKLGNFIRNSGIKRLNTFTNTIEDYAQQRKLGQNILNDVLDIAIVHCDDEWCKTMYSSSLGKILFNNGYYDFSKGVFYAFENPLYDHSIIFIEYITYDWIFQNAAADKEYIDSVKQRLFITPFGADVADYYLLNIARGLAGDVMKRALFGIGNGNTGKSAMSAAIDSVCCGYCGTFNANNIIKKKLTTGDEGQQSRWIMMLLSKRIIISNEIEPDVIISGTALKKITSGGFDKIVARGHGGNETEFKISFLPIIFANDLDKISPMDDAIVNRVRAINYTKTYTLTPDPGNPDELLIDEGLKNEIITEKFRLAFMSLLMQAYKTFVKNKLVEFEPVEIKKAFISTFGHIEDYITTFCNEFEFTDNAEDFLSNDDINEWIKNNKLAITSTKMSREINKYIEKKGFTCVEIKIKKIGGKCLRGWIGIKERENNNDD